MAVKRVHLNDAPPAQGGSVFHPGANFDPPLPPAPPPPGLTLEELRHWIDECDPKTATEYCSTEHFNDGDSIDCRASIHRHRWESGLAAGVDEIVMDNGNLAVRILPTRGLGVHFATFREPMLGSSVMGWMSPVGGVVHPAFVNLQSRNGLGWLDGFSELICRCGLASNGPPGVDPGARSPIESHLTLHGRIANIPATDVVAELDEDRRIVSVSGTVRESTLFGPQLVMRSTISSQFDSLAFTIEDEIENAGSTPTELQLLYHINIGRPFLDEGVQFRCASDAIAPRDPRAAEGIETYDQLLGPTPGYAEQAYYIRPRADENGQATALLRHPRRHTGMAVTFDVRTLPCLVLWKCTQLEADGYVAGLEPATNFPNFKAYERQQQRVIELAPGARFKTRITLTILPKAKELQAMEKRIEAVQGGIPPIVHSTPQPGWSPAGESK